MFKFTIEANSVEELQLKIDNWVKVKYNQNVLSQKQVHSLLQQAQPVDSDSDAEAVVESFQHAQSATVPHLHQNPTPAPVAQAPVNNSDELDVKGLPYDARIHSAGKSKNQDGTWRYRRGVDPALVEQVEKEISKIRTASPVTSAPIPPVPFSQPAPTPQFQAPTQESGNYEVQAPVQMAPPLIDSTQYQQVAPAPVQPPPPAATPSMLAPPDQTQAPTTFPGQPTWAPDTAPLYQAFDNVDKGIVIPPGQKPAHTLETFQNNLTNVLAQLINEKKITKEYIESLCKHFNVKYIWNVLGSATQIRELYESFASYGLITKLD